MINSYPLFFVNFKVPPTIAYFYSMYFVRPPFFLQWYYANLTWRKTTNEKTVYLTFDDGPIPNVTEFVLNTLRSFDIKATFFCIGDNITKHPAVFERIKKEDHAIGNHTYHHLKGWKTDDDTYLADFEKCQALTQTNLFRPPYGRIKKSQIRKLKAERVETKAERLKRKGERLKTKIHAQVISEKFKVESLKDESPISNLIAHSSYLDIVMWDVLSGDFDTTITPEKCYQNVIKNVKNGSIIVFHDSLKAWDRMEYALPRVVEELLKQGYRFEKL